MDKHDMLEVSDEVIGILREGGSRSDCFLEQVAKSQKIINVYIRRYKTHLTGIDSTTENTNSARFAQEPMYFFSNNLGGYTACGLCKSLEN